MESDLRECEWKPGGIQHRIESRPPRRPSSLDKRKPSHGSPSKNRTRAANGILAPERRCEILNKSVGFASHLRQGFGEQAGFAPCSSECRQAGTSPSEPGTGVRGHTPDGLILILACAPVFQRTADSEPRPARCWADCRTPGARVRSAWCGKRCADGRRWPFWSRMNGVSASLGGHRTMVFSAWTSPEAWLRGRRKVRFRPG